VIVRQSSSVGHLPQISGSSLERHTLRRIIFFKQTATQGLVPGLEQTNHLRVVLPAGYGRGQRLDLESQNIPLNHARLARVT
jgi:hypothetical protein